MQVKIGITSGWEPGTVVGGWPLVYVNKGIIDNIVDAGAIPIIIPVVEDEGLFENYIDMIDGIIVAGEVLSIKRNVFEDGGDNVLYNSNPLRYKNEKAAIQMAIKKDIPILGICRGHQVLNVEEGGTMKDGDITIGNDVIHQQGGIKTPDQTTHKISIIQGTKLHKILGEECLNVNSFHRQAVGKIPSGYMVSATTKDGNIEAIETEDNRFIMGLQFHPEMMKGHIWSQFFRNFVKVVSEYK